MKLYEKLHKETSKEYAYRVIKNNIMSVELKPGEILSESDLAKQLNLSRTPIREVIMTLKSEHLVEVKPQIGTYVSLIDFNIIREAVFMRYTLEKEVLMQACKEFDEEIIMELEKNLFAQNLIVDKKNKEVEFHNLDKEFHRLLFKGVDKSMVWDSITSLSTHYNRLRVLAEMNINKQYIIDQHKRYLDIIKNNKIEKIETTVTEHIKEPATRWDEFIENNEEVMAYLKNKTI